MRKLENFYICQELISIMEPQTANIPTNFTESGKIFGLFEIRNTVEALILTAPVAFLFFKLLPFGLTAKIITSAVLIVPIAGFSLIGIQDYSLTTFLRIYLKWRKSRRILTYKGAETS